MAALNCGCKRLTCSRNQLRQPVLPHGHIISHDRATSRKLYHGVLGLSCPFAEVATTPLDRSVNHHCKKSLRDKHKVSYVRILTMNMETALNGRLAQSLDQGDTGW